MLVEQTRHPDAEELRAFGKGLLAAKAAAVLVQSLHDNAAVNGSGSAEANAVPP